MLPELTLLLHELVLVGPLFRQLPQQGRLLLPLRVLLLAYLAEHARTYRAPGIRRGEGAG